MIWNNIEFDLNVEEKNLHFLRPRSGLRFWQNYWLNRLQQLQNSSPTTAWSTDHNSNEYDGDGSINQIREPSKLFQIKWGTQKYHEKLLIHNSDQKIKSRLNIGQQKIRNPESGPEQLKQNTWLRLALKRFKRVNNYRN